MNEMPDGWREVSLSSFVKHKSGDSKIIKGRHSASPGAGLTQGFSASGPDVWVDEVHYSGPGIVVSAVGARCGKTFLAEGTWTAIANTHAIVPKSGINPKFLWYVTNREEWWIKSGTAQPFVKVKDTLERPFMLPPLDEQEKIVECLEKHLPRVDAASAAIEVIRAELVRLRRSQLDAALGDSSTGESQSNVQVGGSWRRMLLAELVSLRGGFSFKSRDWVNDGVPVVKIANVRNGKVNLEGCSYVSQEIAEETGAFRVVAGDLLMTLTGEIGATGVYAETRPARLNQRVARINLPNEGIVLFRYLCYCLEAPSFRDELWSKAQGMAQPNVSPKEVLRCSINVPDIVKQRHIVSFLDEQMTRIDAIAKNCDDLGNRLSELRRSLLHAALIGNLTQTWRKTRNV